MLKEKVSSEIILAMKSKDPLKKGLLQLIKANIENQEIKEKRQLTSDEEISIIQREVKQTKEALSDAQKYEREDLVEDNKLKLEILSEYLPEQLSAERVKEILEVAGVSQEMNMGQAMKIAMPLLKGKAENSLISKTVKQLIS